ncbi:DNA polymerase III subunit alpha [candidate division KSB1 bacterium]|nr:DNA polymerase III subunit alpha [candidate division KSB1 bacterium]
MFTHLHIHSYYSFCRGVNSLEALCQTAKTLGMHRLAVTDTNGVYGLFWFLEIAREAGITPIIGAQVTSDNGNAVLLCQHRQGYANLCHILSRRHLDESFSLIKAIIDYADGLFVLSNSMKLVDALHHQIPADNLYVELQPGPQRRSLLSYARTRGLPVAATNGVHFIKPNDYKLHKLLRAIGCNTSLSRLPEDELASPNAWLKSEDEMVAAFPDCPDALENTERIAEQCLSELSFGGTIFPAIDVPGRASDIDYLRRQCYEGAKLRYETITDAVRQRLEYELDIIYQKGFAPYFLVVQDIVQQSRRTCGRGSAAASIVSYCLGITHVDPIEHDLFFERFLNPGRKDPPDIDVDFPWDERDDVLDYVFEKYGTHQSAMICNHVTFKARAAVREIAKVYGLPDSEINTVTKKLSSYYRADRITNIVNNHPAYRYQEFHEPWPEILSMAEQLDGIPRNLSVHCGGVVIVPDAIDNYIPREAMPKGVNVIQWEKDQTEDAGLVKMDLLGNRSLAVIRDALQAIKDNYQINIEYELWNPLHDRETQRLIRNGDTIGVFYVESPAMRLLQQKAKTGDFEHLVIHSSMIRPAANVYIIEYLKRLHGEPYEPLHPLLGEILSETYGIMCYQEDVSKVAMALANFDAVEADQLRKILSHKRAGKKMEDYCDKFYRGARANGVDTATIDKIWHMIMSFTGYSFCKPHSASYALVSFKSCYLRAHFPAEFMAAVVSNQGGYYSTFAYISEARRMGLTVQLPDVNKSLWHYTGRNRDIRVGFMQLKGVTKGAIDRLLDERDVNGPYTSFHDFLRRVKPNPVDGKILIKAGVFDELEPTKTRPELMWQLTSWAGNALRKTKTTMSLFDEDEKALPIPPTENYTDSTVLQHEVETLGCLISRHPLTMYQQQIKKFSYINANQLCRYVGKCVTTIGWLVTRKATRTKNDEMMEFISFEDTSAIYETVFFPKAYQQFCYMMTHAKPYKLQGKVEEEFGTVTLSVERAEFL